MFLFSFSSFPTYFFSWLCRSPTPTETAIYTGQVINNLLQNLLKKTKRFRGNVFPVDLSFYGIFKIMFTNTLTFTWHVRG